MKPLSAILLTVLALAGCNSKPATNTTASPSSSPAPAKKVAENEYQTGRNAFQRLYIAAHQWAPDAKPFRLQSEYNDGDPASEGKAGVWRASFGSAARSSMKSFQWTGITGPGLEQGISHSGDDSYSVSNTSTKVFELAYLKFDSDKAYEVAQKHGGEKITKANPKTPVFYT